MGLRDRLRGLLGQPSEPSRAMADTAAQLAALPEIRFLAAAEPDASARQPLYRQVATNQLFNWLAGIPDPDEVLRRTGRSRADLRQLLRDAELSQAVDTRRDNLIATPWRLEGGAARGSKFVAAELTPVIDRMLSGFWEAALFGYQVGEVIYARRGANIGIEHVSFIGFEYFRPTQQGLRYFPLDGSGGAYGVATDPRKFFVAARNATERNPYGEALLSALYWPVTWRLQGWQLWLDFLETFGAPIVVGRTSNYNKFVEAMVAQGVKRTIGWEATTDKDALDTISATGAGEFEEFNEALNATIQRMVLGQTLTSTMSKSGGSFAAANVHDRVREDKRRADARMVTQPMQAVVSAVWALNNFPGDPPQFLLQDDVGLEKERADRDKVLSDIGVRFTPEYFAERYDLEREDFEVTEPAPPQPPGAPPRRAGMTALLSPERFTPQQQVIERGIDEVIGELGSIIADAELKAAIRAATSPEDLTERLAVLLHDADASEFQTVLERALFAADLIGYVHAERAAA